MDNNKSKQIIEEELLKEIPAFEDFLSKMGFKRVEGAIYGLLVLSKRPLTSEEIEKVLGLSQSAVSTALKRLYHFGTLETSIGMDQDKRIKYHSAKTNAVKIVASIFRKREQETILEFKATTSRIIRRIGGLQGDRGKRLKSIMIACEMAEAVINFVLKLSTDEYGPIYDQVVKKLPKVLDSMTYMHEYTTNFTTGLTKRLKGGLSKLTGENISEQ